MKGDIVTFKPIARLLCASLCLSACFSSSSVPITNNALAHCQAVAVYIAGQYATRTDHVLPVQYEDNAAKGFITIDEPSIYDVMFQHKGFDAVVETCLARHNST